MADDMQYTLDIAVSELTATCSCGRLTMTFHSEPSAAMQRKLAASIEQHKAQYPGEEHAFTVEATGVPYYTKEAH